MGRSALGSDSDTHPTCRVPRTRRTRGYWLFRYSKTKRPAPITTALTIPVKDLSPGSNSSHSLRTAACQGSLLHKSLLDQRLLPLNLFPSRDASSAPSSLSLCLRAAASSLVAAAQTPADFTDLLHTKEKLPVRTLRAGVRGF